MYNVTTSNPKRMFSLTIVKPYTSDKANKNVYPQVVDRLVNGLRVVVD